jgi:hypothetical protein
MARGPFSVLGCGALLVLIAACTQPQEQEYDFGVDAPDPALDPTETRNWEPMREGIEPPPEHRQPIEFRDEEEAQARERYERRLETGNLRAEEDVPNTPTEQPLPVDAPIPDAMDDRPAGIDPTEEPLIDPVGEPQPRSSR